MHLAHLTTFPTVTKIKYDRKQNRHAYTHTHVCTLARMHTPEQYLQKTSSHGYTIALQTTS